MCSTVKPSPAHNDETHVPFQIAPTLEPTLLLTLDRLLQQSLQTPRAYISTLFQRWHPHCPDDVPDGVAHYSDLLKSHGMFSEVSHCSRSYVSLVANSLARQANYRTTTSPRSSTRQLTLFDNCAHLTFRARWNHTVCRTASLPLLAGAPATVVPDFRGSGTAWK
jgi:hypothetical protein